MFPMTSSKLPSAVCCIYLWMGIAILGSELACASSTDLLNDNTNLFSDANHAPATLNLRPFVQLPSGFNNINSMTTRPGDNRLYVTTAEGTIFRIDDNGSGGHMATPWFNLAAAMPGATNRTLWWDPNNTQTGLQSVAFHPDFTNPNSPGYGKFYVSMVEQRPNPRFLADHNYLGNSVKWPVRPGL